MDMFLKRMACIATIVIAFAFVYLLVTSEMEDRADEQRQGVIVQDEHHALMTELFNLPTIVEFQMATSAILSQGDVIQADIDPDSLSGGGYIIYMESGSLTPIRCQLKRWRSPDEKISRIEAEVNQFCDKKGYQMRELVQNQFDTKNKKESF